MFNSATVKRGGEVWKGLRENISGQYVKKSGRWSASACSLRRKSQNWGKNHIDSSRQTLSRTRNIIDIEQRAHNLLWAKCQQKNKQTQRGQKVKEKNGALQEQGKVREGFCGQIRVRCIEGIPLWVSVCSGFLFLDSQITSTFLFHHLDETDPGSNGGNGKLAASAAKKRRRRSLLNIFAHWTESVKFFFRSLPFWRRRTKQQIVVSRWGRVELRT